MDYKTITFVVTDGVATITMNRPDRLNALNMEMAKELIDAIHQCGTDDNVRAVVLQGAGRAFSAGGDVKEMKEGIDSGKTYEFFGDTLGEINKAAVAIRKLPKPVIASIKGFASGAGFNLALSCDIRFAADNAKFSQAFVNIGLVPDTGGTYTLPRLVGIGKALELFFTGDFIDAKEAERLGILNKSFPEDQLDSQVVAFAKSLARKPTRVIGKTKYLIQKAFEQDFAAQAELERQVQIEIGKDSSDFVEGIKAFFEKREARFIGK